MVARPALGVAIGSAPIGIVGVTALLLARRSVGQYSTGAAVAGALTLGTCIGIAVQGRVIDRVGIPRVLLSASLCQLVSSTALIALLARQGPVWAVTGCAVFAGAGEPQVGGSMRGLWSALVPVEEQAAARALSGLLLEVPVLLAPLLLVALLSTGGPAVALLIEVGMAAVGAVLVAGAPAARAWKPPAAPRAGRAPRSSRGRSGPRRLAVAISSTQGFVGGIIQVAAVAHATSVHIGNLLPVLIAGLGVGSVAGIGLYGNRSYDRSSRLRVMRVSLSVAAAAIAVAAAVTLTMSLIAFAVALLAVGFVCGPITVRTFSLADTADHRRGVAAFADIIAAGLGGSAVGSAISGPVIDRAGPSCAFILAAAAELAGTLLTLIWPNRRPTGRSQHTERDPG